MVRLVEFETKELPFNVINDLKTFMNNDKIFYRKSYYPCMVGLQSRVKSNSAYDINELLDPMIERACEAYSKKYDIPKEQLLTAEQRHDLISEIMKDELPRLRREEY